MSDNVFSDDELKNYDDYKKASRSNVRELNPKQKKIVSAKQSEASRINVQKAIESKKMKAELRKKENEEAKSVTSKMSFLDEFLNDNYEKPVVKKDSPKHVEKNGGFNYDSKFEMLTNEVKEMRVKLNEMTDRQERGNNRLEKLYTLKKEKYKNKMIEPKTIVIQKSDNDSAKNDLYDRIGFNILKK